MTDECTLPRVIREAVKEDARAIASVARESWFATYRGIFDDAFIESFLARAYAIESIETCIARDVFIVSGEDAFAHAGATPEGYRLYRIYARPARFGSGIGRRLIAELESRLRALGVGEYCCDVHEENARALAFYERCGFVRDPSGDKEDHVRYVRRLP